MYDSYHVSESNEQQPKNLEEASRKAGIDTSWLVAQNERVKMDVFGVQRLSAQEESATVEDGLTIATAVEALVDEPCPPYQVVRRADSVIRYLDRPGRPVREGIAVVSQPYERPTADIDHEYTYLAAIQNFRIETNAHGEITATESLNVDRALRPHVMRKLIGPGNEVTLATKPASRQDVARALDEMRKLKPRSDSQHPSGDTR